MRRIIKWFNNIFTHCKYYVTYFIEDDIYQIASTEWNPLLRHNRGGRRGDYIDESFAKLYFDEHLRNGVRTTIGLTQISPRGNRGGWRTNGRPMAYPPVIFGVLSGLLFAWAWGAFQSPNPDFMAHSLGRIIWYPWVAIVALLGLFLSWSAFESLWIGMHRRDQYWVY